MARKQPFGDLLPRLPQRRVKRGDNHIQCFKDVIRIIEASVGQDLHLGALVKTERIPQLLLQLVNRAPLRLQPRHRQPIGDTQTLRVIRDHQVVEASFLCASRHLLERQLAIRPIGVRVKLTPYVLQGHQIGQFAGPGSFDLAPIFTQFRRNPRHAKSLIDLGFLSAQESRSRLRA